MTLAAGTRFGPYEIVGAIGAGGMGEVYRARDPRLGRDVAIKVLPASLSADPERLRRFEQEARATAALSHPNILAIYDVGSHDGVPYVVTELLEGGTLRERLPDGPTSVRKAVEYGVQIARGLAAAHERNIVHRDLKPENVFVTTDGHVKLLDFGLAKLVEADPGAEEARATTVNLDTKPGTILGTVGYMSPEQVRGQAIDHRTDIFSLGIVLYEMLAGRRPFHGLTAADTIAAIVKEDPADLPLVDRHIPAGLERIVDRCLEKTPTARFQTASDLGFALEGLSSSSGRSEQTAAMAAPPVRRAGARVAWTVAAVSLLALAGASLVVGRHFSEAPSVPASIHFEISPPDKTMIPGSAPPVISPDGRQIAYGAITDGVTSLWVRRLDDLTAERLAGTEGVSFPFWSPDSQAVAFFAEGTLKKVPVSGGPVVAICDVGSNASAGGAWAPDNTIVFAPGQYTALQRVSAAGGTPAALTTLAEGEAGHRWPTFLPDGQTVVYIATAGAAPIAGTLWARSLDSDDRTSIGPSNSNALFSAGHLLFVRAGNLVAVPFDTGRRQMTGEALPIASSLSTIAATFRSPFSVSDTGVLLYRLGRPPFTTLTWFDRNGKSIASLEDRAAHINLAMTPDGRRLAVSRADGTNIDIWLLDLARSGALSRLTFDPAPDFDPIWSPDGLQIVFSSPRSRTYDLYRRASNGSGQDETLLKAESGATATDWSPDGRFIAFASAADVWVWAVGGGAPTRFMQTPFAESDPTFSPDGKWLAYTSNESGRTEVHVQPFPSGGGKYQVSRAGGIEPSWRGDGRELFYLAPGGAMMAVPIESGKDFQFGTPQRLFETGITSTQNNNPYVVAKDGQRFLIPVEERTAPPPITVLTNWMAGRSQ